MKTMTLATVAVLTALAAGSASAANFVADGDFSSPSGGPSYTTYNSGSNFGPWSVTSGSVDLIGGYWQSPTAGGGSVDLDGNAPGAISQALALAPGAYTLNFYLSGNPDGAPTTKALNVSVGSLNANASYTIGANSHANMLYTLLSYTFTATGPTTLTFTSLDTNTPYGPSIGGVSVSAVPEPVSWAMMLVGFAVAGGALRSRLRNAGRAAAQAL